MTVDVVVCGSCGCDLRENVRFCGHCGASARRSRDSANNTVTCLYSADRVACLSGAPHALQNLESDGSSVPHDSHDSPVVVSATRPSFPLGSTSISCHRWSGMSVISTGISETKF